MSAEDRCLKSGQEIFLNVDHVCDEYTVAAPWLAQQRKVGSTEWMDGLPEPRARTLLRSMIAALDRGDSDTYWKCLEMLNTLHLEMMEPSIKN
jgi:hypothetical protein